MRVSVSQCGMNGTAAAAATRHCHTVDEIGRLFAKKTRIDSFQFSIPSALCIDAMNREKRPR